MELEKDNIMQKRKQGKVLMRDEFVLYKKTEEIWVTTGTEIRELTLGYSLFQKLRV